MKCCELVQQTCSEIVSCLTDITSREASCCATDAVRLGWNTLTATAVLCSYWFI